MHNLGVETCVEEAVGIHPDRRMEGADIDSFHIQEEVEEDTDAFEDTLEIAVSAVEEQKSINQQVFVIKTETKRNRVEDQKEGNGDINIMCSD